MPIVRPTTIKLLICDVDGVLSDGRIMLDNHGNEYKQFHVHDGLGLKMLQTQHIDVAIISQRHTACVTHRMNALGITQVYQGVENKLACYETLLKTLKYTDEQVAYIGDDLPDIPVMQRVGLSIAVANAVLDVKTIADWQTTLAGGNGAVREVCDHLLKARIQ